MEHTKHIYARGYANFNRCIANIYVPFNAVTVGGNWVVLVVRYQWWLRWLFWVVRHLT